MKEEILAQLQIRRSHVPQDQCDHPDMVRDADVFPGLKWIPGIIPSNTARCPDCGLVDELE